MLVLGKHLAQRACPEKLGLAKLCSWVWPRPATCALRPTAAPSEVLNAGKPGCTLPKTRAVWRCGSRPRASRRKGA